VNLQLTGLPAVIEPMTARAAAAMPDSRRADRHAFEVKADGWRALAFRGGGKVRLTSRQTRPLT
jgi:ATP-dependent DNA ligase